MMRKCVVVFLLTLATSIAAGQGHSYTPPQGVVASQEIAKGVAKIYLSAIYGTKQIEQQLPLVARLSGDIWTVSGTLSGRHKLGGVAEIDLSKKDGKVLRITHSM